VEWLWFGLILAYALVLVVWCAFAVRTLRCHPCGTKATALAYQIGVTAPPIFQLVYRCPRCRASLWKRYVHPISRFPDYQPDMPPRPSVVAVYRQDDGKIGSWLCRRRPEISGLGLVNVIERFSRDDTGAVH